MKARNILKKATGALSNTFDTVKDSNVSKKATGAVSNTVDAVKDGSIAKMAKEALPNTVDTLKGENGRKAQVYAWGTVAMAGAGIAVAGVAAAPLMAVGIVADVVGGAITTHNAVKKDETQKTKAENE